jgi:threonylcarbamoyladenosine tRNA methylthiotransferase MtaB
MTTFATEFLGCKVALADSQAIRERLAEDGHREAADAAVRVVTTCCVTAEAVAKSRKAVRRAARSAERVFVTGCAANLVGAGFEGLAANVTVVNGRPEATAERVAGWVGRLGCAGGAAPAFARTRAYVKVQDGCSFGCSYCVIPAVRGPSRSRPAAAVLDDVRRRAAQGHREVVLTGINLGCFRDRPAGLRLAGLLRAVAGLEGIGRVRLSSIEVNHLNERLLDAMRETPTVSRHLHVPLQSGDDGVLRAMARRYDSATYLRRVGAAEDFNLTTDVIVGFPAEDEPAFERTLRLVEEASATKVHVFPYSPRPGTVTAAADTVPKQVKRERSARLRALSHDACLRRWRDKVGAEDEVLVDRPGRGYGDDYSPWLVDAPVGELVRVRGAAVTEEGILAA